MVSQGLLNICPGFFMQNVWGYFIICLSLEQKVMEMDKKESIEESIGFVSRHYDREAFDEKTYLRAIVGNNVSRLHLRPLHFAAAIAGAVLVASACVLIYDRIAERPVQPAETIVPEKPEASVETVVRSERVEFNDASLGDVIDRIEKVYGVKVTDVPKEDYRLTLSYEGTAADLVATINELLGTDLQIKNEEE